MTFSTETNSGLYRVSANDIGMSVASSKKQEWTTAGTAVTGTLSVSGASNLSGGASITGSTIVDAAGANVGTMSPALNFGGGGEAISSRRTVGSGVGGMDFWTASVNRLSINNSGGIQVPGEYAATPGLPSRPATAPRTTSPLGPSPQTPVAAAVRRCLA
jgi:hypothetical protein